MSIDHIEEIEKSVDNIEHVEKFNPFHDSRGRFSSSHGMASYSANPKTKAGQMAISRSTAAGYGGVMNVHRESKGENIRMNDNWIKTGQKPNKRQLSRAQANAPKTVSQARQNAHTNRVKGTMGATETANAKHPVNQKRQQAAQAKQNAQQAAAPSPTKTTTKPKTTATPQNAQNAQQNPQQAQANTKQIKQKMKSGATMDATFDQSKVAGALNKEFKGTAEGRDLTKQFDATKLRATDKFNGSDRFTNQVADIQGFNSPAKKVSQAEFDALSKACGGEVMFRTVNAGRLDGKIITSKQFKDAYTKNDDLTMNGPSGRVYGDGHYATSAKMQAGRGATPTKRDVADAKRESSYYGYGNHSTMTMTWLSKPNIITEGKLTREWNNLSASERAKFGNHKNTYACAKGYDAIHTSASNYTVIFNRSKLAILDD